MFKMNFSSCAPGHETLHKIFFVSTKPTTIAAIIVAAISGSSVYEKSPPTLHSQGDFLLGNYSLTTGSLDLKPAGTNTVPAIILSALNLLLHNVICT